MAKSPDLEELSRVLKLLQTGAKPAQISRVMGCSLKSVTQRVARNPNLVVAYFEISDPAKLMMVVQGKNERKSPEEIAMQAGLPILIVKSLLKGLA